MIVHNVIKGKRYISWSGEVTITCPESGSVFSFSSSLFPLTFLCRYTATLSTKDKSKVNVVSGYLSHFDDLDKKLYEFEGVCGEKTFMFKPGDEANKKLLFDTESLKLPYIYYLPVRPLIIILSLSFAYIHTIARVSHGL